MLTKELPSPVRLIGPGDPSLNVANVQQSNVGFLTGAQTNFAFISQQGADLQGRTARPLVRLIRA